MKFFIEFIRKWKAATWAAIFFFIGLLIVGLMVYADYGVSWDEAVQINLGEINYHYMIGQDTSLLEIRDRWYGPIFEIFLHLTQNNSNQRMLYLSRHRLIFLTFFMGCIFFYFLCKRLLKHPWLALIGTACLVLSPRIFADAFYNSKDIPFLVLYILSMWSMLVFLNRPTILKTLLHAAFSAALITIRLPGLLIPALTIVGLFIEVVTRRHNWKSTIFFFAFYLVMLSGLGILIWPALWPDPIHGFIQAFQLMSHFPLDLTLLFMGQKLSSLALPWFYIPVWIVITTPNLYLICFVPGFLGILWNQKAWLGNKISPEQRDEILILFAFLLPLLTIILIKSVLYDAWRQMFFIYPAFLLIALKGMYWIWKLLCQHISKSLAYSLGGLILIISLLPVAFWMVKNHPYQNVYFNRLAGKDMQTIQQNYMGDYWGLSYREGLEYLLSQDHRSKINVFLETDSGHYTLAILPKKEALRLNVVSDVKTADYYVANYYIPLEPYPYQDEIYSIHIGNGKILSVFKLTYEE